ncbi:hypothetical protein BDW59DRAFT_171127 [Aspergillus cavernicola]|uniref:Uncharacterized protein n=1 Tax=Aspergillus cavernicola TaxID=176166 RepID=A0ABR4IJS7_9EURO
MVQSDPDERIAYLACQHIFHGSNSLVRKRKNLFDISPALSTEQEASEAEAARDEANAIREISEREASREVTVKSQMQPANEGNEGINVSETRIGTNNPIQPLYPVCIYYRSQHIITTSIQKLVEEGCFAYAQRHFPQLLVKDSWDCPEATAVGVECLAKNAQLFLKALNNPDYSERVSMLRRKLNMVIEELKYNKVLLEERYLAELKKIHTKHAALDIQEQDAKNAIVDGDLQCLDDIDKSIERVVQYSNIDESIREEGKRKMPVECPELSDSEEEILESVVAVNSSDCTANQL